MSPGLSSCRRTIPADRDVHLGIERMDVPMRVDDGLPEPETVYVSAGGGRRDPLGRDVVLVSLAVVVGDDRVDRVGPDQIVDESDRSPVLDETPDRELP